MTSQTGQQKIAKYILPNIWRSAANQVMEFGQFIEREKYFSSKIMQKMRQRDYFQASFCFFKKLYVK